MKKSMILLLILLFMSSYGITSSSADAEVVNYVVVYDEAHLQFFTNDLMATALAGLNQSFDVENEVDVTIELEVNNENFTNSNLQGADLVIIPSPNLREDGTANVDTSSRVTEEDALEEFLQIGGSILYMANPYSINNSIAGHYSALNNLIVDSLGFNVQLGTADTIDADNVTVVLDEFNNDGNNSHVFFTGDNINGDIWNNELNEISSVLFYGSQISENFGSTHFGNASGLTYSVDKEYEITLQDTGRLKWLSGNTVGSNDGRGVIIGSTIMFSDLSYENDTKWIEMEDNQELFENLVAWLLGITPLDKPVETVDEGFGYFLSRNVLLSVLLPGALLLVVFGTLIRTKSITLDKIFQFRIKQKGTKKDKKDIVETTKTTTKKAKKKSTKKTTKKKRRKRT